MIIAGIDPGKTGAMVILADKPYVYAVPLMVKGKTQPSWIQWASDWSNEFFRRNIDLIVIEQVASRPGQGISSAFNFGRCLGFVHALSCLSGSKIIFVTPSVWKTKFGLLKADKNSSREKVRELIPELTPYISRVKDDGIAEAALLALYGKQNACG